MGPHALPGIDIVLHLLSGRLELPLDDETYDVAPGDLVQFGGARVDSTAVLVFAPSVED